MRVKDVMHKGVDWVSPDTPITEIAKLMQGHDIGCIPIGENDRLIGMVTDRDIVCKGLASKDFNAARAGRDDRRHPLLTGRRRFSESGASHGDAEGPQAACYQQEQADGRHDQPG